MTQAAKAQEPSMEEILASIRRIIADDDASKPQTKPPETSPPVAAVPPRAAPLPVKPAPVAEAPASQPEPMNQNDVDAMLADLDAPPGRSAAKSVPQPEVLELTEAMAASGEASSEPAPAFRTIDGESDVVFTDRSVEAPAEPAVRTVEEAKRQFAQADRSLMSNATAAAVDSAFNSLANTVLIQNARTLEDLVKEMMRPMLKAWLDDNLPSLVDRIVRAEIERVARGR